MEYIFHRKPYARFIEFSEFWVKDKFLIREGAAAHTENIYIYNIYKHEFLISKRKYYGPSARTITIILFIIEKLYEIYEDDVLLLTGSRRTANACL